MKSKIPSSNVPTATNPPQNSRAKVNLSFQFSSHTNAAPWAMPMMPGGPSCPQWNDKMMEETRICFIHDTATVEIEDLRGYYTTIWHMVRKWKRPASNLTSHMVDWQIAAYSTPVTLRLPTWQGYQADFNGCYWEFLLLVTVGALLSGHPDTRTLPDLSERQMTCSSCYNSVPDNSKQQ